MIEFPDKAKRIVISLVYVATSLTLFVIGIEKRLWWLYLIGLLNTVTGTILLQHAIHATSTNSRGKSGLLSYSSMDDNDIENNSIEESEGPERTRITRITLDDK
jgi:hypothetical protein